MKQMKSSLAMLALALAATAGGAFGGSLYDAGSYRPLTADRKAFRRGDVITVQVLEDSSASSNSDTTTRRQNNLSAELAHGSKQVGGNLALGGDFDGGGRTQRAGRLLALLSVSVTDILPNGDLQIAGLQELLVNGEVQRIELKGRVRPQDVSDTNVVPSTRVADAKITYQGEGDLSERQRRGWWRGLLDGLGL
jgi:flagellar L-ring protein precursor FlgH